MIQRDYLVRQAEMFGHAMGKILARLMGLKEEGTVPEEYACVQQVFSEELALDMDVLMSLPADVLLQRLTGDSRFTDENLEKFVDILFLLAEGITGTEQKALYEKCLAIYNYLEETGGDFSFNRYMKLQELAGKV